MLSYATVEPHTLELLRKLMQEPLLENMRLVGGTALALQYGHRISVDLDFFGKLNADSYSLHEILSNAGNYKIIKESKNINIYLIDGIKVDFVNYRYPWIDSPVVEDGLRLASPKDIAAMKVNAIEGRGSRKDFIDIYFLLQHYPLSEILFFYESKYPEHSLFRALMSLTYFDDAEGQIPPKMLKEIAWEEIQTFIRKRVDEYTAL